ncbi:MAG TPA: flagellar hook-length control protein FliK [Solirubrobacteraceae bacterium]|nr:flagellar hook-length control protein FliK [Solirubrobacteraceae bacterium]
MPPAPAAASATTPQPTTATQTQPTAPDLGAPAPAALSGATAPNTGGDTGGSAAQDRPRTGTDQPAAGSAPAAPATAAASAPPATAGLTATGPAAPGFTPAAPAAPAPVLAYGVRLAEAAAKVTETVTLAAQNSISQARIELSPESLGTIQIHLQQTPDGLIARVVAAHPEAAQMLSQHGDDLRRSLQQNGALLLRLDIESSNERRPGAQRGSGTSSATGRSGGASQDRDAGSALAAVTESVRPGLSGAALVNVLA